MNYSITYAGIGGMIALPILVNTVGLTESCSNEIVAIVLPMIPGALAALWGRYRIGDVSPFGVKY